MLAPPVATTKSLMRMSKSVFAIEGRSIDWTRSSGEPTCTQPFRITSTTAADVFRVRGWGEIMMALRALRAANAFTGGVASGPLVGIKAANTTTGLAVLLKP